MEKAALEDPFLAEAMEGYEAMQQQDLNKQLTALREKFATKNETTKIIPIRTSASYKWLKQAAAVLIIGGSAAFIYLFTNKNDVAKQPVAAITQQNDTAGNVIDIRKPDGLNATSKKNEPVIASAGNKIGKKIKIFPENTSISQDSSFIYRPDKKTDDAFAQTKVGATSEWQKNNADVIIDRDTRRNNVSVAANAATNNVQNNGIAENEQDRNSKQLSANAKMKPVEAFGVLKKAKAGPESKVFNAQVLGPDNAPIPFASINIANENKGTYADVNGNFSVRSSDSLLNVEIKSVGYISRPYTLRSDLAQNKIVLQQNQLAAKDEVVVTGMANKLYKEKKAALQEVPVINVEPTDGWDNYNRYLSNNLKISGNIRDKNIHGEVEVSFKVHRNGAISNLKIARPLCNDCDKEALRLIKEGPSWKIKKGRKATAKLKVRF